MLANLLDQYLNQLKQLLHQLTNEQYNQPLAVFHQHTIGEHIRHVIEFFEELDRGYQTGLVNYDNRQRNKIFETAKEAALSALNEAGRLCTYADKALRLSHSDGMIDTNFNRELAFAIDHTVHHMALIRIGVEQLSPPVAVPAHFGVALSTQQHRTACAQ